MQRFTKHPLLLPIIFLFMLGLEPSATYSQTLAHWDFDDTNSGILPDISGNGHDGAITGAVVISDPGGSALHFDGIDDVVDFGWQPGFAADQSFTWEVVARFAPGTGRGHLIGTHYSGKVNIAIESYDQETATDIRGLINPDNVDDPYSLPGSRFYGSDWWCAYALVRDAGASEYRFYVNGMLVETVSDHGPDTYNQVTPNRMAIGAKPQDPGAFNLYFTGDITEARVSNGALNPTEMLKVDLPEMELVVGEYMDNNCPLEHFGLDGTSLGIFNSTGYYRMQQLTATPDGSLLFVSANVDDQEEGHNIDIYDTSTGELVGTFLTAGEDLVVSDIVFAPDGTLFIGFASSSRRWVNRYVVDGDYSILSQEEICSQPGSSLSALYGLELGPDNRLLVCDTYAGELEVYGKEGTEWVMSDLIEVDDPYDVVFHNGKILVSDYNGTGVDVYSYPELTLATSIPVTGTWRYQMTETPDGRVFVATNSSIYELDIEQATAAVFLSGFSHAEGLEVIDRTPILPVVAAFSSSVATDGDDVIATFTNTSTGAVDFYWDFGDGTVSFEQNPIHHYSAPLEFEYEVTLVAIGRGGSATFSQNVATWSYLPEPQIKSVRDVPEDEGGWVFVDFIRSSHDTDGLSKAEMYTVQRLEEEQWVSIATTGAFGEDVYSVLAPTHIDDLETEFRVIAHMNEGNWVSDSVSGMSEDNIAPPAPQGVGWLSYGKLNWAPVDAEDLRFYRIYGTSVGNPENLVLLGETQGLDYSVDPLAFGQFCVSAVDMGGNESNSTAAPASSGTANESIPSALALGNFPNPFNPQTTISFSLPERNHVSLVIYDIAGRRIRTLVESDLGEGRHVAVWSGHDDSGATVTSGAYFARLVCGNRTKTRTLMLVK